MSAEPGTLDTLGIFGLSCGLLVGLSLALALWHVLSIALGARLAGLESPFGRAVLTLLAAIGLAIPLSLGLALLAPALGTKAQVIAGQMVSSAAELIAIKWIYKAPWARALLVVLLVAVSTTVGAALLLLAVF